MAREIPNMVQLKKIAEAGPDSGSITTGEWDELCSLAAIGLQTEEFIKEQKELIAVLNR